MKKVIAFMLVIVFLLSALPLQAVANELKKPELVAPDPVVFNPFRNDFSNGRSKTAKSYNGSFPLTGKLYDQLNARQKDVYDKIIANVNYSATSIDITFASPIVTSDSDYNEKLSSAIFPAFWAVMRDCPERFWYNGCGYDFIDYNWTGSGFSFPNIRIEITFHSSYSSSTVAGIYNQLMDAVDAFHPVGANRYEKLRSIHDYLVCLANYDPNYQNSSANPYGHQPTGCLLSPNLCVCEGYAEAFKIFADREGIPNMLVSSPGHIWNVVLMEDNKWYAIDCTWDDPTISNSMTTHELSYIYFLVGSSTVPPGQSEQFSNESSHQEEIYYTDSYGNSFLNPPLNSTSYAPFSPAATWQYNNTNANEHPGGAVLQTKNLIYICPGTTVAGCFDFSSYGSYSYSGGNKTGSTLTFTPKNGSAISYTVIMHGDVNKDATVNNTDLTYVSDISVGKRTYSSTAPETYAGDLNGDGVVDGFDFALLDRYQSGNYNFY